MKRLLIFEEQEFDSKRWLVYMGSKRKLLDAIGEETKSLVPCPAKVLDLFSGSGIVSGYLKYLGYEVHANDIANYAYAIAQSRIEHSVSRYPELQDYIKYLNSLSKPKEENLYFAKYFSEREGTQRLFYTPRNALFIDAVLESVWELSDDRLRNVVLSELLYKMSRQANTGGIFIPYKELGSAAKANMSDITGQMYLDYPMVLPGPEGKATRQDAIQKLQSCDHFDLIYLDPPYNGRQYSSYYHLLEYACVPICDRYHPTEDQKIGVDPSLYKSPYASKSKCLGAFEELISLVFSKTKNVLLSYTDAGILSTDQIVSILSRYGITTVRTINHRKYTGRGKSVEMLVATKSK